MRRGFLFMLPYVFLMPIFSFNVQAGTVLGPLQATVSGTVTDTSGNPLAGVNLVVESKNVGTISDLDGSFTINAGPSDVLVFSMVGFKTLSVPIAGREEVFVSMEEDVTVLGEVVLNAGYYTVSERERTGSIEKVTSVDIEKQPISNPLAALQGRVAGVEIEQTTGLPGANFNIRVRGRNSIRNDANDPLYVIDGVPFSSGSIGEQQASVSLPGGPVSPLNNINPNDIESIEILKDADATAIYGSRGANGVVLITTKKGAMGKTKVEFNVLTGMGKVTRNLDLLQTPEYLEMRREAYANEGVTDYPSNAHDVNGTWDQGRYIDWQQELFGRTAYLTNVRGSLSGGDAQTQFLVSGNYYGQTTVFPGDHRNDKVSVLGNFRHRTKDGRLSFQLSANYVSNKNDVPPSDYLVLQALSLAPNAPQPFTQDGELNWEGSTWNNPMAHLGKTYESSGTTLIGNARIGYKITNDFELTTNLGYSENHLTELRTIPSTIYDPVFGVGPAFSSAIHNVGKRTSWIVEPQLQYQMAFAKHGIRFLAGLTFQEDLDGRFSQRAFGFTNNHFIGNRSAASTLTTLTDAQGQYRYQAIFGRINWSHSDKYFLNLTGRRDGSSRFGPEKQFANFGAVGAAWLFSEEDVVRKALPMLSFGKLRASYGTTGNDKIGDYQYLDTYSFNSSPYQNNNGLYPTRLFNPDFGWEVNKKLEFSLELGLFNDRILLSAGHYRNRSSNQLVGIPLPATTGFSSINANLDATVENTGWEFGLNTVNVSTDNFRWTTSLNLTVPKTELVDFPFLEGSTYASSLIIGESLNIRKVYQLNGVDPETGIYQFEDFNGDGSISSADDREAFETLDPNFFGGLDNSFSVGRFRCDVLFQFSKQLGNNFWYAGGQIPGAMANQPAIVTQRWQEEGDNAAIQQYATGSSSGTRRAFSRYALSDASISDASFLRLKTVNLSYTLAEKQRSGFGCEVYLNGQNLWTLTDYLGLDPENRNSQTIPPLRLVSLGLRLTL
jgi:TonB-linked SusC/RagA family outer membrane protein